MTKAPSILPLRPDYGALRNRGSNNLVRAATAYLISKATDAPLERVLKTHYPDDHGVELLTRAATVPGSTTSWSSPLAGGINVADFVNLLSPSSAAAAILSRGVQLQFDGKGLVRVLNFVSDPNTVAFLGEGKAIPAQAESFSEVDLKPHKCGALLVFTRELLSQSTPNIEAVVKQVLSESLGRKLDQILFDSAAEDTTRPAGLRNGISALTPATAASTTEATCIADIKQLAATVASVSGDSNIVLVANPGQALAIRMLLGARLPYPIFSSFALGAGVVIAIATNTLAVAVDTAPRFEETRQATLVLDTAGLDLTVGSAISAPTRSLFQTVSIAMRLLFDVAWMLRTPSGLAWTTVTTW